MRPLQPSIPVENPGGRSQTCLRLESQLATIDRGVAVDPARADQIKRYEDWTPAKQQAELDRLGQQSQRLGCQGGGFFALFSGQSPQCGPLNNQIQQMRANLDRSLTEIQRLQGNSGEREGQRRESPGGPRPERLRPAISSVRQQRARRLLRKPVRRRRSRAGAGCAAGGHLQNVVRANLRRLLLPDLLFHRPGKFAEDEQLCRRLCPAAEVTLYSHRNPGEDVARAVSANGRSYSELPNAFSYRKQYNAACQCRAPGQSWADALRQGQGADQTVERGDIVVTEERARQMAQPRFDAQGKPVKPDPGRPAPNTVAGSAAQPPAAAEKRPPPPRRRKPTRSRAAQGSGGRTDLLPGALTPRRLPSLLAR